MNRESPEFIRGECQYAKRYYKGETSVVAALCNPNKPDPKVYDRLAEELDTTTDDPEFDTNFLDVLIPQSIVEQIRKDAIEEYLQSATEKEDGRDWDQDAEKFSASISSKTVDDIISHAFYVGSEHWCKDCKSVRELHGEDIFEQVGRGGVLIITTIDGLKYALTLGGFLQGVNAWYKDGKDKHHAVKGKTIDPKKISASDADAIIQYALFGGIQYKRP